MNNTLKQYKVVFSTPINYAKHNCINTINDWLSIFIEDFYNLSDVNTLLTSVNEIIAENDTIGGPFDTQSMYLAIINCNVTSIYKDMDSYYDNPSITSDFNLPTQDFQIIVQAWRDYLVSSRTPPKN
jgi:hypothetical protein